MKYRLIFLFVLYSSLVLAQNRRTSLSLEIGPSFALKDFASKEIKLFSDTAATYPGFAKTGLILRVVFDYKMSHNMGFQADFLYAYNSIDAVALGKGFSEKYHGELSVIPNTPWSVMGILVGPYIRVPLMENFSFIVKGKLGGVGVYNPDYALKGKNQSGEKVEYFQYVSKTFALAWSAGGGLRFRLNDYYISLNADYQSITADFKNVTGQNWSVNPPEKTTYSFRQKIQQLSITLGVAYIF